MFITLSQLDGQFLPSTVLVNFANVTHCYPQERTLKYRYDGVTKLTVEVTPPDVRIVTVICFTAGLAEEPDSILVAETLDQIKELL